MSFYLYRKSCKTESDCANPVKFKPVRPHVVNLAKICKKNKKVDDTKSGSLHVRTKKSFAALNLVVQKSPRNWYEFPTCSGDIILSKQLVEMYQTKKKMYFLKPCYGMWAEWKEHNLRKLNKYRKSMTIFVTTLYFQKNHLYNCDFITITQKFCTNRQPRKWKNPEIANFLGRHFVSNSRPFEDYCVRRRLLYFLASKNTFVFGLID